MTLDQLHRETQEQLLIVAGMQGDVERWRNNCRLWATAVPDADLAQRAAETFEQLSALDEEMATEAYRLGELLAQIQEARVLWSPGRVPGFFTGKER